MYNALEKEHRKRAFKTLYFDEVVNLILDEVALCVKEIEDKQVYRI